MSLQQLDILISRLKKVQPIVLQSIDAVIEKHQHQLIDQNIKQLLAGLDSEGRELMFRGTRSGKLNSSRAYTSAYDRFKAKLGGQVGYVDLRLHGQFHTSIKLVKQAPGTWKFMSTIDIFKYLVKNYGEDIVGVTLQKQEEVLKTAIQNDVQQDVVRYLAA